MTTRTVTTARVQSHSIREEKGATRASQLEHVSVMPQEVLQFLSPLSGDVVVDGTAGAGGHSELLLKQNKGITLIALDSDAIAVKNVTERLASYGARAIVRMGNFRDMEALLKKEGIVAVDKVLLDLGWNMTQLASGRGFSFLRNEPLNMSYGKKPTSGFTAEEIVNGWSETTLADVFYGYGEERYAKRIAKAIVTYRETTPIKDTFTLVDIIRGAVPAAYRKGKIHPATRSFQALRIAVNDELGSAEEGLRAAWRLLKPAGRIAVITFHSIEDRKVKRVFQEFVKTGEGALITKKPIVATREEIISNPPSRSAKLRVIEKLCTN